MNLLCGRPAKLSRYGVSIVPVVQEGAFSISRRAVTSTRAPTHALRRAVEGEEDKKCTYKMPHFRLWTAVSNNCRSYIYSHPGNLEFLPEGG